MASIARIILTKENRKESVVLGEQCIKEMAEAYRAHYLPVVDVTAIK